MVESMAKPELSDENMPKKGCILKSVAYKGPGHNYEVLGEIEGGVEV